MVTILQTQGKRSKWGSIGAGLGLGLGKALEDHSKNLQNKKRDQELSQGLTQAELLFSDPNLSPEQKQIGLFKALRSNPDLAKTLGSQLSGLGPKQMNPYEQAQLDQFNEEKSFFDKIFGNKEDQPISNMTTAEDFDISSERAPARGKKQQFDYRDPTTWSDKQINQFRSIEGKTAKSKTLSNMAENEFERRQESKKAKTKHQESIAPLQSAFETIDRMEKLGKKGNLGIGTKVRGVLSPEARKDAAEYERLGKSLIQYSTNIPIRNRQEFETLAHDLYDPSINDASREGILMAMRRIIENSMKQYGAPEETDEAIDLGIIKLPTEAGAGRPSNQDRPSLTSFLR